MSTDADLRSKLEDALTQSGNHICSDCGQQKPEWAAVNLGIFLCIECAGIHRRLGTGISRVKSIKLDRWTEDTVLNMISIGNSQAKHEWEAKVPVVWPKPCPESRLVCREQWIRAKYERKEFTPEAPDILRPYMTGLRQGFLHKRKKSHDEWNTRYFVLDPMNLSYFINSQDVKPKAIISLLTINATFNAPGSDQHANSLLITYRFDGKHRNLFVYSDTGHEIMDWYLAIRCAKLKALRSTFPHLSEEELIERISWDFIKSGYLHKMPPSQKKFQRRFFVLDKTNFRYYNKPTDAYPLGEVTIGSSDDGFEITDKVPEHLADQPGVFMLKVPYRSKGGFPLLAETEDEKKEWMSVLKSVIEGPPPVISLGDDEICSMYENERDYSLSFTAD